jgi:hypothetical protein
MFDFAAECLETGRWDTIVPVKAISVLEQIQSEIGDERPFGTYPGVADVASRFADGLQRAIAESPEGRPGDTPRNWGFVVGVLVQAGHDEEACRIFELVGDRLRQRDLDWARIKLSHARGLAFARTGPAREQVAGLERIVEARLPEGLQPDHFDPYIEMVQEARAADPRPEAEPWFRDAEAILRQLRTFYAGEWVELKFDDKLSGWYAIADEVELADDGTLCLASNDETLGVQITPLARFQPPLRVEAELAHWPGKPIGRHIGLMHGSGDRRALYASSHTRGVFLDDVDAFVLVYDDSQRNRYQRLGWRPEAGPFQHFRLKVWPEVLVYYANRKQLIWQTDVADWSSHKITIGEQFPTDRPNSLRVRNVRVHRLDHGPPPSGDEFDRWREFYERERELDPRDAQPYLFLAIERYHHRDYDEALALLNQARERNAELKRVDYYMGATLLALHQYQEAVPCYERAIAVDSDDMRAHSNLAWILAAAPLEHLRDGKRALSLARRACELKEYEDWLPLCSLAAAHAELGDFDQAREWIRKSLNLAPDDQKDRLRRNEETLRRRQPLRIDPQDAADESPATEGFEQAPP